MSKATPATQALDRAGIVYALHVYDYDPSAERIGLQAAESLGVDPAIVFKTLMTLVDGRPVCAVLPSDREAALKRLAQAAGGKTAQMMPPADAERATGYKIGGISPLGRRRATPTVLEAVALRLPRLFVNGGQRGLQIELAPQDLVRAVAAIPADFT